MTEQLEIADQGALALTRSRAEAFAVARARVLDPNAPNTQRVYKNAIGLWTAYCDALDLAWAPIDAAELVTYLEQLGRRCAPNTVRLHLAALCGLDIASRVTPTDSNPTTLRKHEVVKRWERSWSREHPLAPRRRAAALGTNDLERLLAAAAEPQRHGVPAAHVQRYVRDRCLILFGVCGALRGNDLAGLQYGDVQPTDRGLQLTLTRSKTDQSGEGASVGLMPQGRASLCPVDAFATWKKLRGDTPGPLFVAIGRDARLEFSRSLSERQITRLVSTYAQRAKLELVISAHSLRATFATLAARNGKGLGRVMSHGRWKTAGVAATYVRQGELFTDNASSGLLD